MYYYKIIHALQSLCNRTYCSYQEFVMDYHLVEQERSHWVRSMNHINALYTVHPDSSNVQKLCTESQVQYVSGINPVSIKIFNTWQSLTHFLSWCIVAVISACVDLRSTPHVLKRNLFPKVVDFLEVSNVSVRHTRTQLAVLLSFIRKLEE